MSTLFIREKSDSFFHPDEVEAGSDPAGDQHVQQLTGHLQLGGLEVLQSLIIEVLLKIYWSTTFYMTS